MQGSTLPDSHITIDHIVVIDHGIRIAIQLCFDLFALLIDYTCKMIQK